MPLEPGRFKGLILDMDGVLWRQNQAIVDLPQVFRTIGEKGMQVSLATNNATLSVEQYLEKLHGFNLSLRPEQIVTSPQVAVSYLKRKFPSGCPVFVIGENGLLKALQEEGFEYAEKEVSAVVVGMDRQLNFEKLCKATLLIRAGAFFLGTNGDRSFPVPEGLVPGVGATLAALETASDVKPHVVGKPDPLMYEIALQRMGLAKVETLVVGDRLETDILGGQRLGCKTALVLSGVTNQQAALDWQPQPDYIENDLAALVDKL